MSETSKKLTAQGRLALLFDDGVFTELDAFANADCGAKAAFGTVGGATVFAFVQDGSQAGSAVDAAQSRKLAKVFDLAAKTGSPVVTVFDSKGVKIDDGFAALASSGEILKKMSELSGVVPLVSVVAGTCGGFAALCAAQSDVCIMAKDAELFLTSAFVDKANGGKTKLVGSAEYAVKSGVAALVCDDESEAIAKAVSVVRMLPLNNLAAIPDFDFDAPAFDAKDVIASTADEGSIVTLFDGFGCAAKTALATVGGTPCGIVAVSGDVTRDDAARCSRVVEICDAFSIPVITFVDSEGFVKSADNDVTGGITAAARLAHVYAEATTVKVSVVTGSAIGAIFTALCGKNASADMSFAWNGAVISPVTPAAAVDVLWSERIKKNDDITALADEYAKTVASAEKAAEAGAVEAVLEPAATRDALISALDMLAPKRVSRLPKKHGNLPM